VVAWCSPSMVVSERADHGGASSSGVPKLLGPVCASIRVATAWHMRPVPAPVSRG
jgi:hypothetical protein